MNDIRPELPNDAIGIGRADAREELQNPDEQLAVAEQHDLEGQP